MVVAKDNPTMVAQINESVIAKGGCLQLSCGCQVNSTLGISYEILF